MRIAIYHVDSFSGRIFHGNSAAVCLLQRWLPDETLQAVAAENNLSDTAFLIPKGREWAIRWFTPQKEYDLSGNAALAAAYVLFEKIEPGRSQVNFYSAIGELAIFREGQLLSMVFPRRPPAPCRAPPALARGLRRTPVEVLRSRDYIAVFESEEEVRALEPDLDQICHLDAMGLIATAPSKNADFVLRFFAPRIGLAEDPATGSVHSSLVPYWAARLGRTDLRAIQVSSRGGEIHCTDHPDAVIIAGRAVIYLEGSIEIPDEMADRPNSSQ